MITNWHLQTALVTMFLLLLAVQSAANDDIDVEADIAELMAVIGEERILGGGNITDVFPSSSDCIGENRTLSCSVDTFAACDSWPLRTLCWASGYPNSGYGKGPWAYTRYRYKVTFAEVLDDTAKLPWSSPIDPAIEPPKNFVCFTEHRGFLPEPGDVALVVEVRECLPGGPDCVVRSTDPYDYDMDLESCARIEPCEGEVKRTGLVLRHLVFTDPPVSGWLLGQRWVFSQRDYSDSQKRYLTCD